MSNQVVSIEEVEEIIAGAPADQLEEDKKAEAAVSSPAVAEVAETAKTAKELFEASKVSFRAPEEIPSIRLSDPPAAKAKKTQTAEDVKISAINLEDIEGPKEVQFEKVELPQPKLVSAEEKVDRDEVLRKIESVKIAKEESVDYTPIDLDELAPEPQVKAAPVSDKDLFNNKLDLSWDVPES